MSKCIRIYGKKKTDEKFQAFNYADGYLVNNLIFASVWNVEDQAHVQGLVDSMNEQNPYHVFEVRVCPY